MAEVVLIPKITLPGSGGETVEVGDPVDVLPFDTVTVGLQISSIFASGPSGNPPTVEVSVETSADRDAVSWPSVGSSVGLSEVGLATVTVTGLLQFIRARATIAVDPLDTMGSAVFSVLGAARRVEG